MEPTNEIIPGRKILEQEMVYYAKDQPEYVTLPMWAPPSDESGLRIARFKLSWRERFQVLFGGSVWLSVLTFGRPLQPVKIEAKPPKTQAPFHRRA